MEKGRKEGRREGNEEIAAPKSRDRRARELASSPLIISETRIHILRKSRGELSRGRDEKVEREITSRRGGIKCEERARPAERPTNGERQRGRERGMWGGVGVPCKRTEMRRTGRRTDRFERTSRERERQPRRGSRTELRPRVRAHSSPSHPAILPSCRPVEITEDTEAPWDWRATGLFRLSSLTDTKAGI